jgi:tetratricopeptide (TPR) repeat protein
MTAGAIPAGLSLLLSVALIAAAPAAQHAGTKTAAERITFYRSRTGGPATYPIYARLGLAYLDHYRQTANTRDWEQAVAALRQSLQYQTNFEALLGLAMTLSERHHFAEALPYAEEALRAMPSDIEAAGTLFDIHLALGDVAAADKVLQEMLKAQRGFHALSRLAALREYHGDLHGALEAMREARDAARRSKFSPNILAWTEVRIGALHVANCQKTEARHAYERALREFFANSSTRTPRLSIASVWLKLLTRVTKPPMRNANARKPATRCSRRNRAARKISFARWPCCIWKRATSRKACASRVWIGRCVRTRSLPILWLGRFSVMGKMPKHKISLVRRRNQATRVRLCFCTPE